MKNICACAKSITFLSFFFNAEDNNAQSGKVSYIDVNNKFKTILENHKQKDGINQQLVRHTYLSLTKLSEYKSLDGIAERQTRYKCFQKENYTVKQ